MNDEKLSALLDDELPPEATREAVSELLAEPQARAAWRRYHLIGDALRASAGQETSTPAAQPRRDNVLAFPTPEPSAPPARKSLSRTGLGLAAAAALAAVALIVATPSPQGGAGPQSIAEQKLNVDPAEFVSSGKAGRLVANGSDVVADPAVSVSQTGMIREDEARKRMSIYLTNFNEQRARQRATGAHPYVHIVGYDTP